MPDINVILFAIAAFDAAAVLLLGIVCAVLILFGIEAKKFWERVPSATGILVCTSLACGAIVWVARSILI